MEEHIEQPIYAQPAVLLEFSDVVDKVNHHYGHSKTMYDHIVNGTIDQYYEVVLDDVIYDLSIMPMARMLHDHDTEDDQASVTAGFRQITDMLGTVFNKDSTTIFKEMVKRMNEYPVDDVREAYQLRHKNALH